jgi:hypothetical protein
MVYSPEVLGGEQDDVDLYDIGWIMESIDLESVLDRVGVRIEFKRGEWYWGYCPDHLEFVGKEPSHPKWSINENTGLTKCFTEPRVSNLVFTVGRLKKISPFRAAEWILGHNVNSIESRCTRIKKLLSPDTSYKEISVFDIEKYRQFIENGTLGPNSIGLLARNDILPESANDFDCVEFQDGYYRDRLIFPVKDINRDMRGFIATDTLGVEEWLKRNPTIVDRENKNIRPTTENDYRKVLYPANFKIGKYLIGEDKFSKGDIAILVEGCRDVIKLRQEGFSGSLGTGGTNLSDEQLLTLSRLAPSKLIIMLDGDRAGREGSVKIANKCLPLFRSTFIVTLKENIDPKDLSREEILFYLRNHTERLYEDLKNYTN